MTNSLKLDKRNCNGAHSKNKLTTDSFIERARSVHGDRYEYSKVVYINNREKVTIECKEHGDFLQIPNSHLCGSGCPKCGITKNVKIRSSTTIQFIDRAYGVHGDRHNYSEVIYKNAHCKVIIKCPVHGKFKVDPNNFLRGHGCGRCYHEKHVAQDFIAKFKKIHDDVYDYSKVKYLNNNTKVCIVCKKHGDFWQLPRIHHNGHGCPTCSSSKGEKLIGDWLGRHSIRYDRDYIFSDLRGFKNKPLRFDFYLPDLKILIEFDGQQHFRPIRFNGMYEKLAIAKFKRTHECDILKNRYVKKENIPLLRVSYKSINIIDAVLELKILNIDDQRANDPLGDVAKGLLIAAMDE